MSLGAIDDLKRKDFTILKYELLLDCLIETGYKILTVKDAYRGLNELRRSVILRHDIDKKPNNALQIARLEKSKGIISTYYFRTNKNVFKPEIIREISEMGHEIGFHYEVFVMANGNHEIALRLFHDGLKDLRNIVPIRTICKHGSPLSRWDEAELWKKVHFHEYDIECDPSISFSANDIEYFTDTGRRWDGEKYIIRDKLDNDSTRNIRSTDDLISLFKRKSVNNAMINVHCQRWNNRFEPWVIELIGQNMKNIGKLILGRIR